MYEFSVKAKIRIAADYRISPAAIGAVIFVSACGFLACAVHAAPGQSPQDRCTQYAQRAVAQYHAMKDHPGCRIPDGPRWQDNTDNHYKACLVLPEFVTKSEESARDNHLRACGGSSTSAPPSASPAPPDDLGRQSGKDSVPPAVSQATPPSGDDVLTDDQFTKAYVPNSTAGAPVIDLLTGRVRNFSAEAALSLIDIRDFTFAFDRFDTDEGRNFSQRTAARALKHLQHKLATEDLLEPGTTAAQKRSIEETIRALDGIAASTDARLAVALKQLIAKYRIVLRGELIFGSEQVVYRHAQAVRDKDTGRIAEENKSLAVISAAGNEDMMKDLVLDLHAHDAGMRDAQMATNRPRVGTDWDVPVDEALANYTSLVPAAT